MDKKIEIINIKKSNPFLHDFLSRFSFDNGLLPWAEKDLSAFDQELLRYEKSLIGVDVEKGLIDRNELLISYAISKAEDSALTILEAEKLRDNLIKNPDYDFIKEKIRNKKKLTAKDYEELEFFNIIKTFRKYSSRQLSLIDFTPEFILGLHQELSTGLDLFAGHLPGFNVYNSGHWRDNDLVRVASYAPAPHKQILSGVEELTKFIQNNPSAINVALFHAALYALHPFTNGNKRVCRILEYLLLRANGYNRLALYNASYYYHKHKNRYYKKLLDFLLQSNFNHFVSFLSEALFYSMAGVIKTSLAIKKREFLKQFVLDPNIEKILRPLVKNSEIQFGRLWALNKRRPSKQTFSNYLSAAAEHNVLKKRIAGRNTYYGLAGNWPENDILKTWLKDASQRIPYIPEEFRLL